MDRKQTKRPSQGSRKDLGSKRNPPRIVDALAGEKLKGLSAVKESSSLPQVLGGRAGGGVQEILLPLIPWEDGLLQDHEVKCLL